MDGGATGQPSGAGVFGGPGRRARADQSRAYAKRSDCAACPLKRQCTTGLERRLSRDVHQDARDYAQALMQTEAYRISRVARKKIETLFGEAKQTLSLVRLRLRGLSGARDEFLLTAAVQNLKRLAVHATRPLPQPMTA